MNPDLFSGMTITLQSDGAQVRDVAIRWSPLPIERLLIGQRAGDADTLIPAALALCRQAHCAAAQYALAAAAPPDGANAPAAIGPARETVVDMPRDPVRDARVRIEAARETLRRWLLDFPVAFGDAWPDGTLAQWPRLDTATALAGFCARHVFGETSAAGIESIVQWLAFSDRSLHEWAARGASVPARWLHTLLMYASRPLVGLPAHVLFHVRCHAAELLAGAPAPAADLPHADLWDAPTVLPDLASGLLTARLRHLAWICVMGLMQGGHGPDDRGGMAVWPDSGGERFGNIGMGWARTARGLLVHLARVEQGRVTAYRILPPTCWNFGASTLLRQALVGRSLDDARQRFAQLVLLLDPCVSFTLDDVVKRFATEG